MSIEYEVVRWDEFRLELFFSGRVTNTHASLSEAAKFLHGAADYVWAWDNGERRELTEVEQLELRAAIASAVTPTPK